MAIRCVSIDLQLVGSDYVSDIYEPDNVEKLQYTPVVEMKHGQIRAEQAAEAFVDERMNKKNPLLWAGNKLFVWFNHLRMCSEKVDGLLCFRCCAEERSIVFFQYIKVALDVACVTHLSFDAKVCADKAAPSSATISSKE
jgi:hypothetical protein